MIEAQRLTKRYGRTLAVDRADFVVRPGRVTGFLGPVGAGKSTTLRLALGIDRPTAGSIVVAGRRYADLAAPLREVGASLDARAMHGGRNAFNHLLCLTRSAGLSEHRIRQVLGQVGLEEFARRPIRTLSLGMRQRLGLAAALLGDPRVLLLDEPTAGLDTGGIRWLRGLLHRLARDGRTVLVTGRTMTEMAFLADQLLIMVRGRVLADVSVRDFVAAHAAEHVRVRSPHVDALAPVLAQRGWRIEFTADRALLVYGATPAMIGEAAWSAGARLHELTEVRPSLNAAYQRLIDSAVWATAEGATAAGHADGAAADPVPLSVGPADSGSRTVSPRPRAVPAASPSVDTSAEGAAGSTSGPGASAAAPGASAGAVGDGGPGRGTTREAAAIVEPARPSTAARPGHRGGRPAPRGRPPVTPGGLAAPVRGPSGRRR